ncbi:MAG: PorP/SprF family type IX secretion system membrane protein, partial [Saprospiraceae bacterium]
MKYPSQIRIALFSGILFLLTGVQASAQTDAMFTKYMFNSLVFNPAYAGSKEHMSIGLLHRSQWFGVNGSPHTQTFTLHTPFKKHDRLAIGGSLINETVGTTKSTTANLSYAYRIRMGQGNKLKTLSVGLQGGMTNWRADLRNLEIYDGVDEAFGEQAPSYWLPNFGFGLHFYAKNYFVGVSIPNLLEYDLRQKNINTERYARTFRHYYFMAGGAIPFGNDLVFRPIVLVKSAGLFSQFKGEDNPYGNYGSPSELDVDLSILLRK